MARKGNTNGGFESDDDPGSAQPTEVTRQQAQGDNNHAEASVVMAPPSVAWYLAEACNTESFGGWQDAATQTEDSPVTLSSWKIMRTQSIDSMDASRVSDASEFVVVETHAAGYDASTQTQEAHLFRYSEAEVLEMVIAWQMITLFIPSSWYLMLYVADQLSSVAVAVDMCRQGEGWWCGLTVAFLVLPSLAINAYVYEQLVQPDIASVVPLNKWVARLLFLFQVAPHYLLGRKVSWCFRAWRAQSWPSRRRPDPLSLRKSPQELWEQAKADTEPATTKWFHSLLESVPQLSIQSYILLMVLRPGTRHHSGTADDVAVSAGLVVSVVVCLTSASSGLGVAVSERAWERVAASFAIFLTLGSRVMVCSGVGTVHPALWFAPVTAATLLGFVTKVSESSEETYLAVLKKSHKYLFEGFIMAVVCPPFNAVGLFSSAPYVLAGLCFLMLEPAQFLNISIFVMSIVGQVIWLAVGFFITPEK